MDWAQLLVIVLAVFLAAFLLLAIMLVVMLVNLTHRIKKVSAEAERAVGNFEQAGAGLKGAAMLASLVKQFKRKQGGK